MPVKGAVSHLFHNLIYAISARQPGKRASGAREWKDLITTPLINKKNISVAQKREKKRAAATSALPVINKTKRIKDVCFFITTSGDFSGA